jgi:glycosyltransferase involved in cell wall biosynthesis
MRVLYVHSGNLFGGVETLMLTMVQNQNLCPGMEPQFALCFEGRFSEALSALGVAVYQLGNVRVSRPLTVRRARLRLKDLLRGNSFDLVILHSAWAQAVFGPAVRSVGIPSVLWIHDVPDGMPWPERWARWSPPPVLVLCNSKYTADRLPRLYPRVESRLIYCPVAPPATKHSNGDLKNVRASFNTPEDATIILQISRLEEHKGHLAHLEALALLRDLPGWVCWQVGSAQKSQESQYLDEIKGAAIRLGISDRIRFLGWQPDVQRIIAASDIYCQPNIYPEPFGITFIEALYARKPVVATAIGGALEIVDESCGMLVSPQDAPALAKALRQLIQDQSLRKRLGNAGPARARELCDPAARLTQVYQALEETTLGRNSVLNG